MLSLIILFLNITADNTTNTIVYALKIIRFCIVILSILLFSIPLIIIKAESNGSISHILLYALPNNSFGKYIPLVKQTNWTTILETPDAALSDTRLPINIPIAKNNIAIIIDTNIVQSIFMLKGSPKISAITRVPTPCNNIIGINWNHVP